jgi:hypothetical protein
MKQRNNRRQDQAQAIQVVFAEVRAASHSTAFRISQKTEVNHSCHAKATPRKSLWRYIQNDSPKPHHIQKSWLTRRFPWRQRLSQTGYRKRQRLIH